jgi:primosomal protein N' (replication factor Y)
MSLFADVILPLPLPGTFTYRIPAEMEGVILPGCRVTVPLGNRKSYTALVMNIHDKEPDGYTIKPITELLDDAPVTLESQIKLWEWISKYSTAWPTS